MTDIGSQSNVSSRLFSVLPPSWFPNPAPNINALLQGFAAIGAAAYSLIAFAKAQTRLLTSTGIFVDLFGFSYLGRDITRNVGEADAAYIGRIQTEILRERATRAGMSKALLDLTGSVPVIFEPWNTNDAGALNMGTLALANSAGIGGAGAIGSIVLPNQVLITLPAVSLAAIPNVAGLGSFLAGLGTGSFELIDGADATGPVTTASIYATINNTKPTGVSAWVKIL